MPNHCSNYLTVSGKKEEMKKFYKNLSVIPQEGYEDSYAEDGNESRAFDFNNFIFRPKSLDITSGSGVTRALEVLEGKANMGPGGDYPNLTEKDLKEAKIYKSNIEKYGYGDWYEWSYNNWGTKWNAYDGYVSKISDESFQVSFSTAWSPPTPVIQKMGEMFPNLIIEMEYQEEGMGFAGTMGYEPNLGFYDNEGELIYLSDCCNKDVNDDDWIEYCEDNDIESWETCPKCKEQCESISEIKYN